MRISRQLASRVAVLAAFATLGGASAFAETRPSDETRGRRIESNIVRRGSADHDRRGDVSANRARGDEWRRSDRGRDRDRDRRGYDRRQSTHHEPYYAEGRVSRVRKHGSGYRVWISGVRYPFYVPAAHYHRDRFRVGVFISLGGIFNRGGYYDYYDGGRRYSRRMLRGFVDRIDYRRDRFVIHDDRTGRFVTVSAREARRRVRPGDYVEVYGDWTARGIFRAYDVDLLDYRRYGYRR